MSDKKSTYRVLIATIIGGKHLTVGAVVELSDKDAAAIGAKFVQLAKVEAPASTLADADDAATKSEADTSAADKTTATKPATKAK